MMVLAEKKGAGQIEYNSERRENHGGGWEG